MPRHRTPRNKKKYYQAPKPKKPKIWGRIVPGLALLRYRPETRETKATAMSRRIKNPSVCIVAPVYAAVEQFKDWSSSLVENLFEIGFEVHRETLQQLRLRATSSYPVQCVCPTFLLNQNKVTVLVRPCVQVNAIQGGVTCTLEEDQTSNVEKLLSENHGVVLQSSGRTFAFWKDKGKYFALIPEGFGGPDNYVPALLKSNELKMLMERSLQNEKGACNLFSIKVLNKVKMRTTLAKLDAEFEVPPDEETETTEKPEEPPEEPPPPPPPAPSELKPKGKKGKKSAEPVDETPTPDQILTFTSDYKEFPDNRGILIGKEYCSDPDRILHTLIAAGLFLHHFPANLWTAAIIRDIMKLGKKLFNDSEDDDLLDEEDWKDRIKVPIKFIKKEYMVNFDKTVFGRITSTAADVPSVEKGLMKFFESHDAGILAGPQMVLIWQNKNNYFMFDPKERDGMGRKWTRYFSSALGGNTLEGSACVTWFRNPRKLAEVYIDNVPLKHRTDPFRIVKITFYQKPKRLENKNEWIGTARDRWILVGTKTICDYSHADDKMRPGKATCMAVSALINAMNSNEQEWNSETVDKMLTDGIELMKQSLPAEKPAVEKPFTLSSIKKIAEVGGKRMRITIIESAVKGLMVGESKHKGMIPLPVGIQSFFQQYRYGVFTVKDIALSIWRGKDNHYYLYYPYEKLFGLPAHCLCATDETLPPMGVANALRFKTIEDLLFFLTNSLHTKEHDEYTLNPVEVVLSEATKRPPMLEYEEFGETGAILHPFKDLHEGLEMFGVRADKQTLANLLVALGFNRINPSTNWSKEDLADILNIGDRLFCKVFMGLPECQSRDYQLQWEDVKPVIGINKFTYSREAVTGVNEIMPEIAGEEGEQMMEEYGNFEEAEEGIEQQDELFVRPQTGGLESAPAAKDFKGILENWDKMDSAYHEAVIENDFFKVAVWKRDNLYFIFDPKASTPEGGLTERRIEIGKDHAAGDTNPQPTVGVDDAQKDPLLIEKRNYNQFNNDGVAYTAWFQNFDEFKKFIQDKIPADHKYGNVTVHQLVLSSTLIGADDLDAYLKPGFRDITPNQAILRGSITQNNPSIINRGKQEFSNCIVAIAFAMISPSNKMTTTLLDVILKYGDRLYTKSASSLRKVDRDKYCRLDKLTLSELATVFSIYKIRFTWKINSQSEGNMLVHDLKKAVGKLGTIENGSAIILCHKGYTMAFWRSEGGYYLYDPYETNPSGVVSENGLPSLSKFLKLDPMLTYLINKFICIPGRNLFEMFAINVKNTPVVEIQVPIEEAQPDPMKVELVASIPKDQEIFRPYQNEMRILKSPLGTSNFFSHILALAALVHSRLQFVELWNSNVSQRIFFLSRYMTKANVCDQFDPQAIINFDDIRTNFTIDNDILCHIAFTKNIQGPIYSTKRTEQVGVNLKNALTLFFRNCQHLLLTIPGLHRSYAIWKENGVFYLFGSCHKEQEITVLAGPAVPNFYDTIFRGTEPEANVNNWYELRSVYITTVPIKEGICKPATRQKPIPPLPMATLSDKHRSLAYEPAQFYDHVAERLETEQFKTPPQEFVQIEKGVELLQSKNILPQHRFYGTKDFFPSLQASCIAASALSKVKAPGLWTKKTLAKLIAAGVSMYINTIAVKGSANVEIIDFKGNLYVADYRLEVCPLTPTIQSASKEDLLMCLTCENGCYLYYPGSSETLCTDLAVNCSCLIKFCTISDLLDRLLSNGQIAMCENVCIGPILF